MKLLHLTRRKQNYNKNICKCQVDSYRFYYSNDEYDDIEE